MKTGRGPSWRRRPRCRWRRSRTWACGATTRRPSTRTPTPWGDWHSLAVVSRGEYKVPEGLQFGYPVRSDGDRWEVVPDLQHDDDAWKRIEVTTKELLQEREMVKELIPTEA